MTSLFQSTDHPTLWDAADSPRIENSKYLSDQLITYLGNKRALLPLIGQALRHVEQRLDKPKLRILDAFAGSGVVSRYFKQYASYLASNDLEPYAAIIGQCYLSNRSTLDHEALEQSYAYLQDRIGLGEHARGIVRRFYAPEDDADIQPDDRVFYTSGNAERIDGYRHLIDTLPSWQQPYFLAPLLSEASIHANTSGVFKGFYKDSQTGVGRFGGSAEDALTRIKGQVSLPFPIFSRFECEWEIFNQDANALVGELEDLDVAYFDPPYNQHPYGSNYFMLNLLVDYKEPTNISKVSGIPADWNRSAYNKRKEVLRALSDLFEQTPSRFVLLSYNDEGFVSREEIERIMSRHGRVKTFEQPYNTFRGCRNLRNRRISVMEHLFLVERT